MTQVVKDDDGLFAIEQTIAELESQRQTILAARRADDLAKAKKLVKQHDFTAKELGLSVVDTSTQRKDEKPKTKLPPKYRNPANNEDTWSGKGRFPKWYEDYIKVAGQTKEQLLIVQP